ncbi:MAG: amidohydrolase family protein [Actinobacteria bacterium]|nr:amidohydrolase family protein [Actinomycetota bacterium]
MSDGGTIDVHQHLWPPAFVDALRARTNRPLLRGWTLYTDGEPPYEVDPQAHDVAARLSAEAGSDRVLVSLSSPLGIETLPPDQAQPLLDVWHDSALALPAPFQSWAAVAASEPDLGDLKGRFEAGTVGLQVGAGELATPAALERLAPAMRICEEFSRPVLVHPSRVDPLGAVPGWWAPVVQYTAQLQAAWWSWQVAGRSLLPDLRICFVAGAGLAPAQHERFSARAGDSFVVDPDVYVDTSSYGRQGLDSLTRALGIDVVVLGSDRPYADRPDLSSLGAAAARAISRTNPIRLLEGSSR